MKKQWASPQVKHLDIKKDTAQRKKGGKGGKRGKGGKGGKGGKFAS